MTSAPGRPGFSLSSEQCEILLAFEDAGSLARLAEALANDISSVSRKLQAIARSAPLLEKQGGRWRLTPLGRQLNHWTRDAAQSQKRLLAQRTALRVAATREFAARILSPRLPELLSAQSGAVELSVVTAESGIEGLLLSGAADLGFDCGRPEDPAIRFRAVRNESFTVVASPRFGGRARVRSLADLLPLPHLQYQRTRTARLLELPRELPSVRASFNDIASVREACLAGHGWAVLPTYAVSRELARGELRAVGTSRAIRAEKFGDWWVGRRASVLPWVERATAWLQKIEL
jgi:DNA-binding transcriptional LysR family regulator